jgi:hypothetical protein
MLADPIDGLVAFLKLDSEVASLSGGRVFGGELPGRESKSMPRPAVVLKPAGGGLLGTGTLAAGDVRVDVDCYGKQPHEAWRLYLAVGEALKNLRRGVHGGTLLMWARPSSRGTLARDPDTDWPVAVSTYQVLAGE